MPQGKTKVKAKLPANIKNKGKAYNKKGGGPSVTKRTNKPFTAKKSKMVEVQKLKKTVSKNINNIMEEELRQKALDGRQSLVRSNAVKRPAPSETTSSSMSVPTKKRRK